jgi:hypothetical protein
MKPKILNNASKTGQGQNEYLRLGREGGVEVEVGRGGGGGEVGRGGGGGGMWWEGAEGSSTRMIQPQTIIGSYFQGGGVLYRCWLPLDCYPCCQNSTVNAGSSKQAIKRKNVFFFYANVAKSDIKNTLHCLRTFQTTGPVAFGAVVCVAHYFYGT